MTAFWDDPVPEGLYFVNAPKAKTRRQATAHYMTGVEVAERCPSTDDVTEVLHQIEAPFSDGSIIDRMITVQKDGTIRKSVRLGRSFLSAEHRNMELVAQYTSVPVPHIHKLFATNEFEHLVMEKMPGITLERAWPGLTDREREDVADQVVQFVGQFRLLQSTAIDAAALHREPLCAGLKDSISFTSERMKNYVHCEAATQYVHKRCAALGNPPNVFTHGDLDWSNIMVTDKKKVCGIIDMESSGYFPPYWEWLSVKRLSRDQPDGSWFRLLEERLGRDKPSQWAGMWEVEELLIALGIHSHWALTPEERSANRSSGWAKLRDILGGEIGPPPQVDYTRWSRNPLWLDVCQQENMPGTISETT